MSTLNHARLFIGGVIVSVSMCGVSHAANLDTALSKGEKRVDQAQSSQKKIDQIDAKIREDEREYRGVLKEVEGLNVYIDQLNKQLVSQAQELKNIEASIRQVVLIERQVSPLMLRMIDALEHFVRADVPFLYEERMKRVKGLKDMMGRSDVTVAEKYRKVMAAYQTEMDYGRTIEAYRGELDMAGEIREVDYLRTGRVAWVFQTLDGQHIGVWNQAGQTWDALDSQYKSKVLQAIRIAREQAAPSLIQMPITAAVEVK
ncbi:MAG: DUF3450 domain-containing protein [Gammaproteobacteria bacterium]|nr:DUF3450 domain-containing protein [Gammaproteobacteria bacterium]